MVFRKLFIKEPWNLKCRHKKLTFLGNMKYLFYNKNNQIGMRLVDFLIHGIIAIELNAINHQEASDLDSKKNQNNPGIK